MNTLPNRARGASSRAITIWLYVVLGFLVAMIVVGGATRLTDSGLSITEWKPVTGALPPLSAAAWQAEFDKYKKIPEFYLQNSTMDLAGFKAIYRWEWGHRLLGRLIGFVVLIPMLVFMLRGMVSRWLGRRLVLILALGGVQGALGWWMVSSGLGGLSERLDVSAIRLGVHLIMALFITGLTFWTVLDVRYGVSRDTPKPRGIWHAIIMVLPVLVLFQAFMGALVAGNDGGYVHNTWPLMDGGLLPDDYAALSPFWRNIVENPALAQFDHRMGAYVLALLVAALVYRFRADARLFQPLLIVFAMLLVQIGLGVWTLLWVTPLPLGMAHQLVGVLFFLSSLYLAYQSGRSATAVTAA